MRKLFFVSIILSMSIQQALGSDSSSGCGPAWYVLKDKSLVSSFLRQITNGILSPVVTLGMTFGTSNCGKHKIVSTEKRSEHLAMVGFDRLRQDAARGTGPFLDAYAKTFDCQDQGVEGFKSLVKNSYSDIFVEGATPEQVVIETKKLLKRNNTVAKHCVYS